MFLQNKYTKWYFNIVNNAQGRNRSDLALPMERHHIIPDCMHLNRRRHGPPGTVRGNPNNPNNLVYLTIKEHFLCHWLLTKMVDSQYLRPMHYALHRMTFCRRSNTRLIAGWQVCKARTAILAATVGRSLSEETKKKISASKIGKRKGLKQSPDHVQKRANSLKGKAKSAEHKSNISQSKMGKTSYIRTDETKEKNRKSRIGAAKDYKWWNDGTKSTLCPVCPGDGWSQGRFKAISKELRLPN
jgi:hypothetical protein